MSPDLRDTPVLTDPHRDLERAFMEEFLRGRGYDFARLSGLPEEQKTELLKAACLYATTRLAEVEARAHYLHELHTEH